MKSLFVAVLAALFLVLGAAAQTGSAGHDVQVTGSPVDEAPNTSQVAPISVAIYEFERL